MFRVITVLALLIVGMPHVQAGNVYKCKDAAGNTTYQEVPCAKVEEQESHRVYQRVRDTPEQTRANFQGAAQVYREQVAPEPVYEDAYYEAYPGSVATTPSLSDRERRDLTEKLNDRRSALNSYRGNSQVDVARRREAQQEIDEINRELNLPREVDQPVHSPSYTSTPPSPIYAPPAAPQVRARDTPTGTKFYDETGAVLRGKVVPGTNKTRVYDPNGGPPTTCRTDDFGNTRCN